MALPALVLSAVCMLSGCGMFRSHKAWETAKQESPLEIPPSAGPSVHQRGTGDSAAGRQSADRERRHCGHVERVPATITDGFVLADSVDDAYRRVGQALERASRSAVSA